MLTGDGLLCISLAYVQLNARSYNSVIHIKTCVKVPQQLIRFTRAVLLIYIVHFSLENVDISS